MKNEVYEKMNIALNIFSDEAWWFSVFSTDEPLPFYNLSFWTVEIFPLRCFR
jgi:hypothetical protein